MLLVGKIVITPMVSSLAVTIKIVNASYYDSAILPLRIYPLDIFMKVSNNTYTYNIQSY